MCLICICISSSIFVELEATKIVILSLKLYFSGSIYIKGLIFNNLQNLVYPLVNFIFVKKYKYFFSLYLKNFYKEDLIS